MPNLQQRAVIFMSFNLCALRLGELKRLEYALGCVEIWPFLKIFNLEMYDIKIHNWMTS